VPLIDEDSDDFVPVALSDDKDSFRGLSKEEEQGESEENV